MPAPVLRAIEEHLELEAELGGYEAEAARETQIAAFYENVAELLGCSPSSVAYCASATDAYTRALSSIAFGRGDVLLTTRDDYISNQIAFMALAKRFGIEVIHAPNEAEGGVALDAMRELIRTHRPLLVAVTHIPTSSGLVQPVAEIGKLCRETETLYLVDACQSVGHLVVDVTSIGCDFLTATGRKFLRGPRGSGFLYVSPTALERGFEPLFIDMRGARWTDELEYEAVASARRFEEWESPYALTLGLSEAVRYAVDIGVADASARALALADILRRALELVPGVHVLDRGRDLCAIVTAAIEGWDGPSFHHALGARGINSSITMLEHARFDFDDKRVSWALRLSPHYYNTAAEVGRVAAAIADLVGGRSPESDT